MARILQPTSMLELVRQVGAALEKSGMVVEKPSRTLETVELELAGFHVMVSAYLEFNSNDVKFTAVSFGKYVHS